MLVQQRRVLWYGNSLGSNRNPNSSHNPVLSVRSVVWHILAANINYITMNELNWLFLLQKDIIHTRLVTSASYLHLNDAGEFNKIE
jgi:hypothetical protein